MQDKIVRGGTLEKLPLLHISVSELGLRQCCHRVVFLRYFHAGEFCRNCFVGLVEGFFLGMDLMVE